MEMHLQLIWMNTSMFKKKKKHKTEASPLGLKSASDLTENNYLKVNVLAMMLQSLLILEVYWVSESYQALAPTDKNSARYSTRLLTLQRPLTPQGHFKSPKSPYRYTLVYCTE